MEEIEFLGTGEYLYLKERVLRDPIIEWQKEPIWIKAFRMFNKKHGTDYKLKCYGPHYMKVLNWLAKEGITT